MANCPNCGVKIGKLDWRPNCKECGVNLVYFDIEKRLLADSERAEAEHRDFVYKTARVKNSFIGSPLAIVRIILSVLPIGALFLPLANIVTNIPFYSNDISVNAIKVYELISTFNFGGLFEALGSDIVGTPSILLLASFVTIVLMVLGILMNLLFITLACSPKGKVRSIATSAITVACGIASIVLFSLAGSGYAEIFGASVFNMTISFGSYIALVLLVLVLVINILLATKKFEIKVVYPEIIPLGYKKSKKEKKKSPFDKLLGKFIKKPQKEKKEVAKEVAEEKAEEKTEETSEEAATK